MSVSANWFQVWFNSPYYHKLYFQRQGNQTDLFTRNLVNRLAPPLDSLIVDLACARGTHAKMMADMGYDVTGIDLAPESIAVAKELENDKLHFYQHDLRL